MLVGSAYTAEVLGRVVRVGATHLGGEVVAIVYLTFVVGAALALPALRSSIRRLQVAARWIVGANTVMLLCWATLHLGGWVISHEAMMQNSRERHDVTRPSPASHR